MYSDSVYIIFTNENKHWTKYFLNKQINHCYIIKPCGDKLIISGKSYKAVDLYTIADLSSIISERLMVEATSKPANVGLFVINSCVGLVKQYLGISNPLILTPYQLYKRLSYEQTKSTSQNGRAKRGRD